jgi:hypothetical protein
MEEVIFPVLLNGHKIALAPSKQVIEGSDIIGMRNAMRQGTVLAMDEAGFLKRFRSNPTNEIP